MTEVLVATYFVVVMWAADGFPAHEAYRARVDGPQQCGEVIGLIAEDMAIEGKNEIRMTATCVIDARHLKQAAI